MESGGAHVNPHRRSRQAQGFVRRVGRAGFFPSQKRPESFRTGSPADIHALRDNSKRLELVGAIKTVMPLRLILGQFLQIPRRFAAIDRQERALKVVGVVVLPDMVSRINGYLV